MVVLVTSEVVFNSSVRDAIPKVAQNLLFESHSELVASNELTADER